jgi:hypothetical protein
MPRCQNDGRRFATLKKRGHLDPTGKLLLAFSYAFVPHSPFRPMSTPVRDLESTRARLTRSWGLVLIVLTLSAGAAQAQPDTVRTQPGAVATDTVEKDAPFVATDRGVVRRMLKLAGVSAGDVVYDLGSGDGRIPIIAAQEFGATGVGVEIDPGLVAKARARAKAAGVADRVEFRQKDLFEADVREATVVTLYLWPEINAKLRPTLLRQLEAGDRIVSHDFRMGTWAPDRTVEAGPDKTGTAFLHLWTVPDDVPPRLMQAPATPR